ncbi:MAG: TIGR04086 family membrane protein [Firmicutes bacterium]|nr:TIGR04086 family membrane protein [Bacillota bacterium]
MKGLQFLLWSRSDVPAARKIKISAVLPGLAWALSVTLAACALMGVWVLGSYGPVYNFAAFLGAASFSGTALGGAVSGRSAGTLGWLHGGLVGLSYGLLFLLLVLAATPCLFSGFELAGRFMGYTVTAAMGGVIGVNLPSGKSQKRRIYYYMSYAVAGK